MSPMPCLLIINGTSSTGKTSLARALQVRWPTPLVYLGLDSWITMTLSPEYWDPATRLSDIKHDAKVQQGTHFILPHSDNNPSPWPKVDSGPVSDQLVFQMHATAVQLWQQGFSVVLDCVLLKPSWREDLANRSRDTSRCWIQMTASDSILAQREQQRGDRMNGVFRSLAPIIHQGVHYDLSIDSSQLSVEQACQTVLTWLNPSG